MKKKNASEKRKLSFTTFALTDALRDKRLRTSQAKLYFSITNPITEKEQEKVDTLILNYIISEARLLQTVEEL